MVDWYSLPNFHAYEFWSPDTKTEHMEPEFMRMLQELRTSWEAPFRINSGWRSDAHNKAVGGAARSYHKKGRAADIRIGFGLHPRFCDMAYAIGFRGIIFYPRRGFVHLDNRGGPLYFRSK